MDKSDNIDELAKALALAQPKIRGAAKDAQNPHLKNKYADLGATWDACRDALAEHGLAVLQLPTPVEVFENGQPRTGMALDTILTHSSGQWIRSRTLLDYGDEKGIKPMQALGSALTYARRYGLAAMVGVCPEDDEGEAAGRGRPRHAPAAAPKIAETPKVSPTEPYLRRWNTFAPTTDENEIAARKSLLVSAVIVEAVDKGLVEDDDYTAEDDRRKVAAKVWRSHPELCNAAWDKCVREAAAEAAA
jgi:hypothetical protein